MFFGSPRSPARHGPRPWRGSRDESAGCQLSLDSWTSGAKKNMYRRLLLLMFAFYFAPQGAQFV